jgi:hypothetical protein
MDRRPERRATSACTSQSTSGGSNRPKPVGQRSWTEDPAVSPGPERFPEGFAGDPPARRSRERHDDRIDRVPARCDMRAGQTGGRALADSIFKRGRRGHLRQGRPDPDAGHDPEQRQRRHRRGGRHLRRAGPRPQPGRPRRFDEFDRMVRDVAIVGAGVRLFLNLISNAVWTVNPPDDLPEARPSRRRRYADQAYDDLFGMTTSWSSVVRKTAAFRLQGFSFRSGPRRRSRTANRLARYRAPAAAHHHALEARRGRDGRVGRPARAGPAGRDAAPLEDRLRGRRHAVRQPRGRRACSATWCDVGPAANVPRTGGDRLHHRPARHPDCPRAAGRAAAGGPSTTPAPRGSEARAKAEARRSSLLRPAARLPRTSTCATRRPGVLFPSDTYHGHQRRQVHDAQPACPSGRSNC